MLTCLVIAATCLCLSHSRPLPMSSELAGSGPSPSPLLQAHNGQLLPPQHQHNGFRQIGHPNDAAQNREENANAVIGVEPVEAAVAVVSEATPPMLLLPALPLNVTGLTQMFNATKVLHDLSHRTEALRGHMAEMQKIYLASGLTGVANHMAALRPESHPSGVGSSPVVHLENASVVESDLEKSVLAVSSPDKLNFAGHNNIVLDLTPVMPQILEQALKSAATESGVGLPSDSQPKQILLKLSTVA